MTTLTPPTIAFSCPLPPVSLRPNRRAAHWATRAKVADEYSEQVCVAAMMSRPHLSNAQAVIVGIDKPWPQATVTYTWRYCGVAPDIDNIAGALKCLQDTLCMAPPPNKRTKAKRDRWYLGLIENDSGIEATFKREKVKTKAEECVVIEIERLP